MKTIWAPWRMEYILKAKEPGCFLCEMIQQDTDRDHLLLKRMDRCLVAMNRYPYNNGHLMVAPYRHVALMEDLQPDECADLMATVQESIRVLKKVLRPDGLNVGINLGKAAGAGLEEHLHIHIVPRWNGDTNFMPVLSDVRVMPQALWDSYDQLYPAFHPTS